MVVKDGRFGPYVTDGETNATLRTGDSVEDITPERGYELLAEKRAKGPAKKTAKKAPAKKAPAKKTRGQEDGGEEDRREEDGGEEDDGQEDRGEEDGRAAKAATAPADARTSRTGVGDRAVHERRRLRRTRVAPYGRFVGRELSHRSVQSARMFGQASGESVRSG